MKNFTLIIILSAALISCRDNPDGDIYLSAKLSPYTEFLDIAPEDMLKPTKYTQLTTGYEDYTRLYFGVGTQRNNEVHWTVLDDMAGSKASMFILRKDGTSGIYSDTIRHSSRDGSRMIAILLSYDPSTDKVRYAWLDENNERSEKAVIIPVEQLLKRGNAFPELSVEKLDGEELAIGSLKGKTVVLNWWQTTCSPCVAEMPGFNRLVEQYGDNPDIVFVAIANNNQEQIADFLRNREFNYMHALANAQTLELFGDRYPAHVIINPEGIICFHSTGGYDEMYLEIEDALKKTMNL